MAKKKDDKKPRKDKKRDKKKKAKLTAKNADKHELYERSVQEVSADVRFINRVYKKKHGRRPTRLREDFCGTSILCAKWVTKDAANTAIGLDLDAPTLAYAKERHIDPLGTERAKRVTLIERDVLDGYKEEVDVCVAFNFSFCTFKERSTMVDYYRSVRKSLANGGAFMLDIHGGPEAQVEAEEETDHGDFVYVWDQGSMDALSGFAKRHIHFRFRDGSEMRNAFSYDWRVWSLPEIQDMLRDAGYSKIEIFWEGATKDGEGNGIFRRVSRAENEDSWIAYIVAWA